MPDQVEVKDEFSITYNIKHHEQKVSKKDLPPGWGATDCILVMSRLKMQDGTEDYAFLSLDGETGDSLSPPEVFKAWVILANMLKDNLAENDLRRELCKDVLNIVYQHIDHPVPLVDPAPPTLVKA